MRTSLAAVLLLPACPPDRLAAQFIRPEDRALFTDLSYVTAVAATQSVVYAATPTALAIYERAFLRLRETVGELDGFPPGGVRVMVADPTDDTAWMAGNGRWLTFRPFGRQWDTGPLPGAVIQVVLDRNDPARGAWFETTLGWYFVQRGGGVAVRATDVPPPGSRLQSLDAAGVRRRMPAIDALMFRITRDDQLHTFVITAAAAAPLTEELFLGTSGNGAFRVDAMTYAAERLPPGLLAPGAGGLALTRGRICVGSDVRSYGGGRTPAGRRGVTCLSGDGQDLARYEESAATATAGSFIRRVAVGTRAVWAASETGLLRFDGRGGRTVRLRTADGLPSDDVRALALTSGGLWVGTSAGLAFVAEGERPEVRGTTGFGAAVGALHEAGDTLWIGSALGLVVLPRGAAAPEAAGDHPALRDPVVSLTARRDTLVVATASRVLWRVAGQWRDVSVAPPPVGRIATVTADPDGLWVAGAGGMAYLDPRAGTWRAFTSAADVPLPVWDVVADRDFVYVATPQGLVRYERRGLVR